MKANVIKSPNRPIVADWKNVFLAGSIEMGSAENWQDKVISSNKLMVNFYNPRRDNWDCSWEQDINNPHFYEQVTWELDMLDKADIILMYFDPNTKSPISLLELGLYACGGSKSIIVCCPDGFWRKGNVDIVCQRYRIPMFTNLETALVELKNRIQ
jgi:hypothetical protein